MLWLMPPIRSFQANAIKNLTGSRLDELVVSDSIPATAATNKVAKNSLLVACTDACRSHPPHQQRRIYFCYVPAGITKEISYKKALHLRGFFVIKTHYLEN